MSRIAGRFAALAAAGRKALVTYIAAGDPEPAATVPAMHALVAGGADLIELGIPFSDPEAEGPAIQQAMERSLAHRTTLKDVLAMATAFRAADPDTPIVLMGYLNSIERMGNTAFAAAAAAAGIDGVLLVNLPPEESGALRSALAAQAIDLVFLLAPTTRPERAALICKAGSGFVYYVSLKGVTGARHLDAADVGRRMAELRPVSTLPLAIGFGVRDGATARALAPLADAVVVGSALVETMGRLAGDRAAMLAELRRQVADLRAGVDGAGGAA